jgi:hypothetical protein
MNACSRHLFCCPHCWFGEWIITFFLPLNKCRNRLLITLCLSLGFPEETWDKNLIRNSLFGKWPRETLEEIWGSKAGTRRSTIMAELSSRLSLGLSLFGDPWDPGVWAWGSRSCWIYFLVSCHGLRSSPRNIKFLVFVEKHSWMPRECCQVENHSQVLTMAPYGHVWDPVGQGYITGTLIT